MRFDFARRQFFMETSYVARVYGDAMRDDFVGYAPTDPARFAALKEAFDREVARVHPYLATLLTIESELLAVRPDELVADNFWAIDDRFRRVVPLATRARYDASVPKRGDGCWSDPAFLRRQSRTLLEAVHTNYLLNIGREKSIIRLKTIMGWSAAIVLALMLAVFLLADWYRLPLVRALVMLACAGVFGAFLSIVNRMQAAISPDAMTEDGIYELTGLRVGWIGILMSFVLGGGFALVLYCVVMAGMLSLVDPTRPPEKTATTADAGATPPPAAAVVPPRAPAAPPAKPATAPVDTRPQRCVIGRDPGCADVGRDLAAALGLQGGLNLFRMLVLAFLAGFAERFVPDILNRLGKQGDKA